jgi:(1->4)-alpha-D-glucan 1-alpha-D-glucosylmutase
MTSYMEKATHEAKVHTSWINPDAEYDAAVREFTATVLRDHPKNRFLAEFRGFHEMVVNWGLYGALAQTLLKLTSPGVPDIYQGQEFWDFSLVDPDNRRPVDFAARRKVLARLRKAAGRNGRWLPALSKELARNPRDGRLKLLVTWRVLQFRREHPDLFRLGDYLPLAVEGTKARHVCSFARQWQSPSGDAPSGDAPAVAIVIVPRLIAQLTPALADSSPPPPPLGPAVWDDTQIILDGVAPSSLRNIFTAAECSAAGSRIAAAEALADFPVAVLTNCAF